MTEIHNYIQKIKADFGSASVWEWQGDPERRDGWTVVGEDEDGKRALVAYDSFNGASSQPLADGIPGEWIMERAKAEELHDRILQMDAVFWPGFNPTVAEIKDGEVVRYVHPPESEAANG